ncbi:phage capsid protein [Brachyspira pulli]|uniref:phage capsid protein n=1 Tax=Brachyspira pulli TaxID=310721 RepID=UPI0030061D11
MIHFKNSVIYVLDNFMNFMADEYIDFSGNKVQGENNLNSLLDDKLKIDCFSLGAVKSMSKSFLWATISEGESRGDKSYIGDSAGFADDISFKATVYKELKAGESFLAYTMIPLALNQASRYWISKLNDEGERIALSPVIKWESPSFDSENSKRQFNDFSSIRGVSFSLDINFRIMTGSYLNEVLY